MQTNTERLSNGGDRLVDLLGANGGRRVAAQLVTETTSRGLSSVRRAIAAVAKQTVYQLLIANVLLQVFDAVATYNGLALGFKEGNPLLRTAFGFWGIGPTLLVLKSLGCTALALVPIGVRQELAHAALGVVAGVYCGCSLIPWLAMFLALLVRSLH